MFTTRRGPMPESSARKEVAKGCRLSHGQVEMIATVLEHRESFSEFLRTAGVKEARRRMAEEGRGQEGTA